ncbi:hypothetical protein V6N13_121929 [Hibiscus sabdariffa]
MCHQDTFVVDIKGWSCTCRLWDLTGIPCPHVVCVVLYREERLEDYVLVSYKKHVYIDLYNAAMPTISSEQFWKDTKMGSLDPPLKRKLPGRPKHKRKREEGWAESYANVWMSNVYDRKSFRPEFVAPEPPFEGVSVTSIPFPSLFFFTKAE